jgi:DNA-binding NtrC family response regulator
MNGRVLIVDDEEYQREILRTIFVSEGYSVEVAPNGKQAISLNKEFSPEVILCDLKLPDMDGIELMESVLKSGGEHTEFIIITGHGTIESAVEAIKKGAMDYITKPLEKERILILARRAIERTRLIKENIQLKKQLKGINSINGLIGSHPAFQNVLKLIKTIAPLDVTVLITGETGTGKGLVAQAIHSLSPRRDNKFHVINCAAIPETLIESELFGYVRGAFTGAYGDKPGLIELSDGGTLFLDEIGELSPALQAKLLRFIEDKKIRRIGGKEEKIVNVRLISATNKDIEEEVKKGSFRPDLYYRLNGFTISIPPLRERISDVMELTRHFIERFSAFYNKKIEVTQEALNKLLKYHWPGNVRQLESVIERAVIVSEDGFIRPQDILLPEEKEDTFELFDIPPGGISLEELEKRLLLRAMEKSGWVTARAAKLLGLTYRTMQYRLEKYGIKPENTPKGE